MLNDAIFYNKVKKKKKKIKEEVAYLSLPH